MQGHVMPQSQLPQLPFLWFVQLFHLTCDCFLFGLLLFSFLKKRAKVKITCSPFRMSCLALEASALYVGVTRALPRAATAVAMQHYHILTPLGEKTGQARPQTWCYAAFTK